MRSSMLCVNSSRFDKGKEDCRATSRVASVEMRAVPCFHREGGILGMSGVEVHLCTLREPGIQQNMFRVRHLLYRCPAFECELTQTSSQLPDYNQVSHAKRCFGSVPRPHWTGREPACLDAVGAELDYTHYDSPHPSHLPSKTRQP